MDFLVEFLEKGGAWVIKDPTLIAAKKDSPDVLLNPVISHLRGVSPSFWKRVGDTIEMCEELKSTNTQGGTFDYSLVPTLNPHIQDLEKKVHEVKCFVDAKHHELQSTHTIDLANQRSKFDHELNQAKNDHILAVTELEQRMDKKFKTVRNLALLYILLDLLINLLKGI